MNTEYIYDIHSYLQYLIKHITAAILWVTAILQTFWSTRWIWVDLVTSWWPALATPVSHRSIALHHQPPNHQSHRGWCHTRCLRQCPQKPPQVQPSNPYGSNKNNPGQWDQRAFQSFVPSVKSYKILIYNPAMYNHVCASDGRIWPWLIREFTFFACRVVWTATHRPNEQKWICQGTRTSSLNLRMDRILPSPIFFPLRIQWTRWPTVNLKGERRKQPSKTEERILKSGTRRPKKNPKAALGVKLFVSCRFVVIKKWLKRSLDYPQEPQTLQVHCIESLCPILVYHIQEQHAKDDFPELQYWSLLSLLVYSFWSAHCTALTWQLCHGQKSLYGQWSSHLQ